jgi:LCP family protein required for cell wall assembly
MAASGEKPYRVYKGGRTKGKVPLTGREDRGDGHQVDRRRRKPWTWKRWTLVTIVALVVLFVIWATAGWLSVRSGVADANKRLPPGTTQALTKQNGLILDSPTNILLLGTDHSSNGQAGRNSDEHSDSMMVLRTDPGRHRITYLSIPRDLGVTIDGVYQKINAAMQLGGPRLAIQTVNGLLGSQLPIEHVVMVDFGSFQKLVDAVGGIDINVPENIVSNRFDCPYSSSTRCQQWEGWRFHKGRTHMDGHTALIYSRIRENRLDPSWTDFKRSQNQQAVMQATLAKLGSPSRFFSLPFNGSSLLAPISTDLSAWDFMQLAWVKFRAGDIVHCRLGGSATGNGFITSTQENIQVVQEVLGNSAPQPPAPGSGLFGPGCVVGSQQFK